MRIRILIFFYAYPDADLDYQTDAVHNIERREPDPISIYKLLWSTVYITQRYISHMVLTWEISVVDPNSYWIRIQEGKNGPEKYKLVN
jgi:hypothetical protein